MSLRYIAHGVMIADVTTPLIPNGPMMLRSSLSTTEPILEVYSPFDRQLAQALQHSLNATLTIPQHAWICHLSAAMRQGHLCVRQREKTITPSPEVLLEGLLEKEEASPILSQLLEALYEGATTLKAPFVSPGNHHSREMSHNNNSEMPLVHDGERWYFRRYWNMETDVIERVKQLAEAPPSIVM